MVQFTFSATTTRAPDAPDLDVSFASSVVLTTLSAFLFLLACVLLPSYYFHRIGRSIVETRIGIVLFFLGALLTTITTLSTNANEGIYGCYRITLETVVGIVVLTFGTVVLFENASPDRPLDDYGHVRVPVGFTHGSMGIIIWVVTLPLIFLELLFAIGAATKSPKPVYAAVEFVSLTQKIVQASVYHFSLRHKVSRGDLRFACSWYLKIVSFFNFAFWVDSIVTSGSDNEFARKLFGDGFSIVKAAYNALLIDYRLLCFLLFLEHSLELDDTRPNPHISDLFDQESEAAAIPRSRADVNVEISHMTGFGYVLGLLCIVFQLINGLQYLQFVGVWSNIFPILVDLTVIIMGLALLQGSSFPEETDGKWRETESKAIDIMVGFMGAVGFIFWLMKSSFCSLWASRLYSSHDELYTYLTWTSVKDFIRTVGILFQLHFFVKMGPHFCCQPENHNRRSKHLFVPAIMLALLAIFISSVVDQYNGTVEKFLRLAKLDEAISAFFQAAAPIHLGFCLHMFLHFFIIRQKMSSSQFYFQLDPAEPEQDIGIPPVTSHSVVQSSGEGDEERRPLISRNSQSGQSESTSQQV